MAFASYDPKEVVIILGGVPLAGYADGTFVDVEFDEDSWNKVTGADGLTSRASSGNYAGAVTVTLQQTSASNDYLAGLWNLDRRTGAGALPVLVKDTSGRSLFAAPHAWVKKLPNSTFSKDVEDREWLLDTDAMEVFVGGNQPLGEVV